MEFVTVTPMNQWCVLDSCAKQQRLHLVADRVQPAPCRRENSQPAETKRQDETRWDKWKTPWNMEKRWKKVAARWTLCHLTNPCCAATFRSLLIWHCFVLGEKSLMLATAEVQPKVHNTSAVGELRARKPSERFLHQDPYIASCESCTQGKWHFRAREPSAGQQEESNTTSGIIGI